MTSNFQISNTYDEVMFAALQGFEPDDDDLASIRVPAGEDRNQFLTDTRTRARTIAQRAGDGQHADARTLAANAAAEYLEKFRPLLPIPARGQTDDRSLDQVAANMFRS